MGLKRWKICEADKALAHEISAETGIDPFCSLLLAIRGITDSMTAEEFISDEISLQEPFDFVDMDKAVNRIHSALENNEKIAIFGDYDCDGVTSTALLFTYLSGIGASVLCRLPTRDEGYGISKHAIDELKEKEITLIITVDNGVSAYDEVDYAASLGIDVVVTDHHLPPEKLPNAVAVVNPKRADNYCEFDGYAGVGVAFLLVCALENCSCEEMLEEYADLVALGTIADVMPVKYDNRSIIKYGLKLIKNHTRDSISALIEASSTTSRNVDSTLISFGLAPRINAAGRMLIPDRALNLLLCDDKAAAISLAKELNELNAQRQKLESDIIAEAEQMLFEDEKSLLCPVIVICGKEWHNGVLGLIASKLSNKYSRPTIALSVENGKAVGSARSVDGVSIHELISCCSDLLISFGGHESAAGLHLKEENIDKFREKINQIAHEKHELMPFNELRLDCKLNPDKLSVAYAYSQKQLEPFGNGNEQPVYGLFGMTILAVTPVGKGKHLKINVVRGNARLDVMKFFTEQKDFPYDKGDVVDLAVTLDINRFNDTESLSVIASDIKPSDVDNDYLTKRIRAYENFIVFDERAEIDEITRDDIARIYKIIRTKRHIFAPSEAILHIFKSDDYFKLMLILNILKECGLIDLINREFCEISYINVSEKVDLSKSETLMKINGKGDF